MVLNQDFSIYIPSNSTLYSLSYLGSIPGSGRSPGEGNGNPLQYSYLENPMDRGAWWLQSRGSQTVPDMTEQLSTHAFI